MLQITCNKTARTEKAKYIVVHTTGNYSQSADARAHYEYWDRQYAGQSADFVVDDKEALQINDYTKYYTWHCGDGKGKNGITNANSIGIEICVNRGGDFDKAVENAAELVRKLKAETGIENVVRHYDASGKMCPAEFAGDGWAAWYRFLRMVDEVRLPVLTSVNDIVWELSERALSSGEKVIGDPHLWMQKLNEDINTYWLARKIVQYLREKRV